MNRLQQLAGLNEVENLNPSSPTSKGIKGSINFQLFQDLNIPGYNESSFKTTIGKVKGGGILNMNDNKILANTMITLLKTSDDALLGKIFANLKQIEAIKTK